MAPRLPIVLRQDERLSRLPLERVGRTEQPYDYCLLPYAPAADSEGKLASLAVLQETFAFGGIEDRGMALVELLRNELGARRTVWGVKHRGQDAPLTWELYFYDRESKEGPPLSLATVIDILAPQLVVDARLDRPVELTMFSIEFSADHLRAGRADGATLYVRGSDLSYDLRGTKLTMGNSYRFFDPRSEIRDLLSRVAQCVHYDARGTDLGKLLPPRLFRAHHVCVANKREADGMYFSRVRYGALKYFLELFDWPAPIRAFVAEHREDLDYLLHDVGFDFVLEAQTLSRTKSGFYGYF